MAMKVYQSGDLVVIEKNSEPVINIKISECSFSIVHNVVYVFNKNNTTIQSYDIVENIQKSSGVAVGNYSQVLTYLNGFIITGSASTDVLPLEGETYNRITLNFKQDNTGTSILFVDPISSNVLQSHDINSIQAVANGTDIKIQFTGGHKVLIDSLDLESTYINGTLVTQVLATAIVELNALFANAGGPIGKLPEITSSSTILLTAGNNINYTITGNNIVSIVWTNLPTGIAPVVGNIFNIIGGSALSAQTITFNVEAINYFGSTNLTITLIISASFTNTYSFEGGSGIGIYNAGTINSVPLYRPADGTGSSDAWSVMCWYKMVDANKYDFNYHWAYGYIYGGASGGGGGGIAFQTRFNTLKLYFGNYYNAYFTLECTKPHGFDSWHCCLITYSGASTGTSTANAAAQFNMYIDGVAMTLTATQVTGTNGYTGSIEKSLNAHAVDMCISGITNVSGTVKHVDTDPTDEISIWSSELSASDAVTLYNSGVPLDLALFSPTYNNWWRNGDNGDIASFPTLNDMNSSGCDLEVSGGSVANYISDVP